MGRMMQMEAGKTERSSRSVSAESRGISTMPPPAPNRPVTAPAPRPARRKPMYLCLCKKIPPEAVFAREGDFIQERGLPEQSS